MFTISVDSTYAQLDRYAVIISAAGFDAKGSQLYVEGCEALVLECGDAEVLEVVISIIPLVLPEDPCVENSPPFDLDMSVVGRDGTTLYHATRSINQWGGADITFKI